MEIHFEENDSISFDHPHIVVSANQLEGKTKEIIEYLNHYSTMRMNAIPIKSDDHILMIKTHTIICVEVMQRNLCLYTTQGNFETTGTLSSIYQKLSLRQFIQVSKNAIMNINHLESLSNSFSGNMTAKMSNHMTITVSRKYLKDVMAYIGI